MPKIARNYQREGFSDLLAQMQQSAAEPVPEKKPREPKKINRTAQVSPAKRRRDSLCKYCAENGVHLKILPAEDKQPGILHCRVRRWEVKQFLKAAAKLKKHSIKAADEHYIALCEQINAPVSQVPAGSS